MALTHISVTCVSTSYLFSTILRPCLVTSIALALDLCFINLFLSFILFLVVVVFYRSQGLTQVPHALDNCSSKVCVGELPTLQRSNISCHYSTWWFHKKLPTLERISCIYLTCWKGFSGTSLLQIWSSFLFHFCSWAQLFNSSCKGKEKESCNGNWILVFNLFTSVE